LLQDKQGAQTRVVLSTNGGSQISPNVRYEELQAGQILLLKEPALLLMQIMSIKIHILIAEDLENVRVLRD
jgi:hypothetical protein